MELYRGARFGCFCVSCLIAIEGVSSLLWGGISGRRQLVVGPITHRSHWLNRNYLYTSGSILQVPTLVRELVHLYFDIRGTFGADLAIVRQKWELL